MASRRREIESFLREGIWRAELEPRTWSARGVRLLQLVFMVGEGFVRDRLLLRASALTYFTILSIVPLLAIVSSIVTAIGVTQNVAGPIFDQIATVSPEVSDQLRDFVANADIGGLGTLGAAALFFTTVLGISNIERALNHIWGVQQSRPWTRRLPDYLAVLIVAPLLLGAGLSLATTVQSQWIVQRLLEFPAFSVLYDLGLKQLPFLMLASGFGFLYWFMPYTSVRPLAAFLGGLVATLGVEVAREVYVGFSLGAARANALYGGFAQVPFFFIFVYVFWAVVLLGAEVAFAYQHLERYRREVRGRTPGAAEREALALRALLEIGRAFRDRGRPWTAEALAGHLTAPVRAVREVLVPLEAARIVAAVDDRERGDAYQLGQPAENVQVGDVLAAVRGEREPMGGEPETARRVEEVFRALGEAEAKGAGSRTLAELLSGLPPPAAEAKGR